MIYLIGGIPGMRKSTVICPCFLAQKHIYHNSTDLVRVSTTQLASSIGYDFRQTPNPYKGELREGVDTLAWFGTLGLIQFFSRQQEDALIEGIAIPPTGIRDLELQDSNLKVRAAFVGHRNKMEFQAPQWNPELEELIETAISKDYLENFAKKYSWRYGNAMYPYIEFEEAERIKNAVGKINRPNFKYFDLIDYIPRERRNGDIAILQLEDYINAAIEIRSFLLGQP